MTRRFKQGRSWPGAALGLTVCLAAAGTASCDKMPLAAPNESTITLYAAGTTVGLNSSIEIFATVIESAGTPVQNGTVVTFTTTLGTIEPTEARTNNGKATVRLLAGTKSGTADVRAFSGGVSSGDALQITVGAAAAAKVELLANPSALPAAGGVVQLTAIVTDAAGNRLSGLPVTFATNAGVLTTTSATTDGNGEARSSLSTAAAAKVTASVAGGAASSVTASLDIPVRVGPTVTIAVPATSLAPGLPATFTVTVASGGAAVRSAIVEFGDGASQAVSNAGTSTATHAYSRSGTYTVTATATDTAGETTSAIASVSVQAFVVSVTLSIGTISPSTGAPIVFTASATSTPAGAQFENYDWHFGDESSEDVYSRSGPGNSTTHQYSTAGPYRARVRVRTTTGAMAEATIDFVVK
ncbi:MAG: polycystin cation channel protein [Acidobacteria bacterium]|nr:polycystin cation channel protein [Acidobacteriota bacterium]